ncbi:MAG: hypothetical protein IPL28_26760 [Chloroflexi bacterium]|nr:hypothetical protein [Chloroflexota bacterium]
MDLIGKLLINPGDPILTEPPTLSRRVAGVERLSGRIHDRADLTTMACRRPLLEEALQGYSQVWRNILLNFQNPGRVTLPLQLFLDLIYTADKIRSAHHRRRPLW